MKCFLLTLVPPLFLGSTSAFVPPPPSVSNHRIHNTNIQISNISRSITRKNNANDGSVIDDNKTEEKKDALRKTILGLLFPIGVAISANAPFLYVILNPPSPDEREVMLMDFCKGDTCTLLGGGSGFVGGDRGGDMIGADALAAIPSLEDFEAMARTAAEMADNMIN